MHLFEWSYTAYLIYWNKRWMVFCRQSVRNWSLFECACLHVAVGIILFLSLVGIVHMRFFTEHISLVWIQEFFSVYLSIMLTGTYYNKYTKTFIFAKENEHYCGKITTAVSLTWIGKVFICMLCMMYVVFCSISVWHHFSIELQDYYESTT